MFINSHLIINNNYNFLIIETDNNLIIPFNYQIILSITSLDVIDSLSALQTISSAPASMGNSLALHIIILLHSIPQSSFQFLWIPSHVGIEHNGIVDTTVKNAVISGSPCKILPPSQILHIVKKSSIDDWNFYYPKSFNNASSMYLSIPTTSPLHSTVHSFQEAPFRA